jgi:hypothetical protein
MATSPKPPKTMVDKAFHSGTRNIVLSRKPLHCESVMSSNNCSMWRDVDVWFCTDTIDGWVAGTVVDAQENKGLWKFYIRPCLPDASVVTLWPQCISGTGAHNHSAGGFVEFDTLKRRNLQEAGRAHDLTKVLGVSEPEVERILAERFLQHQFYTEVGPVLMYLNYWGDLDSYDTSSQRWQQQQQGHCHVHLPCGGAHAAAGVRGGRAPPAAPHRAAPLQAGGPRVPGHEPQCPRCIATRKPNYLTHR